jgi:hypothetical protein
LASANAEGDNSGNKDGGDGIGIKAVGVIGCQLQFVVLLFVTAVETALIKAEHNGAEIRLDNAVHCNL